MYEQLILAREQFINSLTDLVNKSFLPAFVIREVIHNLDAALVQKELEDTTRAKNLEKMQEDKDGLE